jgi:hypothetical protein
MIEQLADNSKWSGPGLIQVQSYYIPEGTEEDNLKPKGPGLESNPGPT